VLAQSPNGKVNGRKLVLATGAYAAADRNFSRKILPLASYVLVTEPAPDRLAEIGWVGGEGVYDYRWALRYVRTTPDGRIAFGSPMYGPGLRPRVDFDAEYLAELSDALVSWFPNFKDVGIECGWGGPIDSTAAHVPFFGTLRAGNVHYAMGFMGEGIGPTHFAGRVLSGMALGIDDEYTRLPLIGVAPRSFPIKAVLAPGAAIAYRSIVRKDRAEDRGESPSRVTEFMAGLPARFGY
jgi:glycine/D-amino acid oxidase-like deaminating enzyme